MQASYQQSCCVFWRFVVNAPKRAFRFCMSPRESDQKARMVGEILRCFLFACTHCKSYAQVQRGHISAFFVFCCSRWNLWSFAAFFTTSFVISLQQQSQRVTFGLERISLSHTPCVQQFSEVCMWRVHKLHVYTFGVWICPTWQFAHPGQKFCQDIVVFVFGAIVPEISAPAELQGKRSFLCPHTHGLPWCKNGFPWKRIMCALKFERRRCRI